MCYLCTGTSLASYKLQSNDNFVDASYMVLPYSLHGFIHDIVPDMQLHMLAIATYDECAHNE